MVVVERALEKFCSANPTWRPPIAGLFEEKKQNSFDGKTSGEKKSESKDGGGGAEKKKKKKKASKE